MLTFSPEQPGAETDAMVERMAKTMLDRHELANACTDADLRAAGFTDEQIAAHAPAAIRRAVRVIHGIEAP